MINKVINENITINEFIGQGGMGKVYKATLNKDGFIKTVAVKIGNQSYDPKNLSSIINEAKTVANLRHPNIAQVYDLIFDEDLPIIVMEYIEGHNLRSIIELAKSKNTTLSTDFCFCVYRKMLEGLRFAHEQNPMIIHHDISPHNVMIDKYSQVKILDFGISHPFNIEDSATDGYKGKICYLSPEVISGKRYDNISDIYSASLVLYEMLCLQKAFLGKNYYEVINNINSSEILPVEVFRPNFCPTNQNLLDNMLNKNPQKRLWQIDEIIKKLDTITIDKTVNIKKEVEAIEQSNANVTVLDQSKHLKHAIHKRQTRNILKALTLIGIVLVVGASIYFTTKMVLNPSTSEIEKIELYLKSGENIISVESQDSIFVPIENLSSKHVDPIACSYLCFFIGANITTFYFPAKGITLKDVHLKGLKKTLNYQYPILDKIDDHCESVPICKHATYTARTTMNIINKNDVKIDDFHNNKIILMADIKDQRPLFKSLMSLMKPTKETLKIVDNTKIVLEGINKKNYSAFKQNLDYDILPIPASYFKNTRSCRMTIDLMYVNTIYTQWAKGGEINDNFKLLLVPDMKQIKVLGIKDQKPVIDINGLDIETFLNKGVCLYKRVDWNMKSLYRSNLKIKR
ncbi:MAG: serine/threonine protein kinase [Bacteriovoracaceae bacterium]|nr:serine/threonine protein kinase [Bacteriovoracaceae bacterium]